VDTGSEFSVWEAVVVAFVGFGGVLIGGLMTGVAQVWKQVVDSRSAAQIIRMELQDNVNRAALAVTHQRSDVRLHDDAWKGHRGQLVPLLPREVLLQMSTLNGACWIVDDWISRIAVKPKEAKAEIDQWVEGAALNATFLIQLTRRSRIAQMIEVILDRPTFPPAQKGKSAGKQSFAEMREKIMQMAQPSARQDDSTQDNQKEQIS